MLKNRVLVLTPRFPYPPIGGDRLRIMHLCRALSTHFELTLLSLCETQEEMRYQPSDSLFREVHKVHLPRWRSFLNTALALPGSRPLQLAYYESPVFRQRLKELAAQHDLVLAHLIRTGQYVEHLDVPRILEMTDAISMNYERVKATKGNRDWKRLVYAFEQKRLQPYEMSTIERFDRVWLTSHTDREFLSAQHGGFIDVIPNGTDVDRLPYAPPGRSGNAIIFIGNMTTLQNQDACESFIREVLPLVRAQAPTVVFRIVGSAPDSVKRKFSRYEGVELTGRLEHIYDGVECAFCGVCPVRAGAGIQNKVLEYLALGLPCVTTPVGLGGVEARDGVEVLVYRDPQQAARQVLDLHTNTSLRLKIAEAGRALVEERYDWQTLYPRFVASCLEALESVREGTAA